MDVVQYTGMSRDDHRVLKMYAVATDRTLGSIREEAMARQMQETNSPGMDLMKEVCGQVREAIAQAEEARRVAADEPRKVNGKKNGK